MPSVCRAWRGLSSCFFSRIGLPQQDPCISGAGARMEQQVVSGPPFVIAAIEEPTPTHQRKEPRESPFSERPAAAAASSDRRPPDRQVVQKRKQIAVVDRHSGPGARRLEGHHARLGARERAARKSKRPLGWAFRRRRRVANARGRTRRAGVRAAQAAGEEPQAIKAKEQRRAACRRRCDRSRSIEGGFAAGPRCCRFLARSFEHLEFTGRASTQALVGGGAKQGSPMAGSDLDVGRERVGPQHRFGGHGRTAKSAEGPRN